MKLNWMWGHCWQGEAQILIQLQKSAHLEPYNFISVRNNQYFILLMHNGGVWRLFKRLSLQIKKNSIHLGIILTVLSKWTSQYLFHNFWTIIPLHMLLALRCDWYMTFTNWFGNADEEDSRSSKAKLSQR